ncbi:hypothetical protein [Rhizobium sp. Root1220]|uniref:hypothetical protein n=1 Tax=Rhizobium sp. Root1220 TaxID=1736432 RepID=UPI0006F9B4BB|nr:hypothetical protein [Rhizobium sp. Root1220]KQV83167.1 hypothetical protein ASC90_21420 [Rhizobium sp. Root1220]
MLYLFLALCVLTCTVFIGRFFTAKTRLVEKTIEEMIERKLSTSPMNVELARLREANGVMRNLLIDIVESEASLADATNMSQIEMTRATKARAMRRREVFGEAILVLQQTEQKRSTPLRNPA